MTSVWYCWQKRTRRSLLWSGKYLNPVGEFNQQQGFGFRTSPSSEKKEKESWLGQGGGSREAIKWAHTQRDH